MKKKSSLRSLHSRSKKRPLRAQGFSGRGAYTLATTTIGAFPKPEYLPGPDVFRLKRALGDHSTTPTVAWDWFMRFQAPKNIAVLQDRATRDAVRRQVQAGITIPTDGEMRRDFYMYAHCRHLEGFDFDRLTFSIMREGSWKGWVPTVTGPLKARAPFLIREWKVAQSVTPMPVKMTIPGPLTIADSTADAYYGDRRKLGRALAEALNVEVVRLARAGCRHIQIDEPLFARMPEAALAYGIENLERVFHGLPDVVTRTVHMCCGYPSAVDLKRYHKANPEAYLQLAPALDASPYIDRISLEDAHRHNPPRLFEAFQQTDVILGVVQIAQSRVETVDEIVRRVRGVLGHIDPNRLVLAPDCGLGMLPETIALQKLASLGAAARLIGQG